MSMIIEGMELIAEKIRAVTDRPVTTDPASVTVTPCVLVELPEFDYSADSVSYCGDHYVRFTVLVIGSGSSRAALTALDALLTEVVRDAEVSIRSAVPMAYTPTATTATADPVLAYRVTIEEWI